MRTAVVCFLCPVLAAAVPPCALLCALAGRLWASGAGPAAAEEAEAARDGVVTLTEALSKQGAAHSPSALAHSRNPPRRHWLSTQRPLLALTRPPPCAPPPHAPDAALTIRAYGAARRVATLAADLLDHERAALAPACAARSRSGLLLEAVASAGGAVVVFVAVAAAAGASSPPRSGGGGAPWNVGEALAAVAGRHEYFAVASGGSAGAAMAGWVILFGVPGCRALCSAAASAPVVPPSGPAGGNDDFAHAGGAGV